MTLSSALKSVRGRGDAAFIPYVTAGDPSLEELPAILQMLEEAGADAIEVGLPFSDPIADGPTIQASSQRALDRGVSLDGILSAIHHAQVTVPIIAMGYGNAAHRLGYQAFASSLAGSGVHGVILSDLLPEESKEWQDAAQNASLQTIYLCAPTSTPERIRGACEASTGFVYAISRMGVTGQNSGVSNEAAGLVAKIREETDLPVCVGFGVSSPETAAAVAKMADGVIVGSHIVKALHESWGEKEKRPQITEMIRGLSSACRRS